MNGHTLDDLARDTALDILKRHAPDCLQRPGLRAAIALLARLGLESSVHLYRIRQQPCPAQQQPREKTAEQRSRKQDTKR